MIHLGDNVRLLKHPSQPDGKIVDISYMNDMVTVRWDDPMLMPHEQDYPREAFFDGTFQVYTGWDSPPARVRCECGSKYDNQSPDAHSSWCPAYKKV